MRIHTTEHIAQQPEFDLGSLGFQNFWIDEKISVWMVDRPVDIVGPLDFPLKIRWGNRTTDERTLVQIVRPVRASHGRETFY